MSTAGERVKQLRKELKITQEQLSETLGITTIAISRIENNKVNLNSRNAKLICSTYDVSYDWLMDGEGEMFTHASEHILEAFADKYNLDDFDKEIIRMYATLSEETKDEIKKKIERLNKEIDEKNKEQ